MLIDEASNTPAAEEGENYFISMTDMMVGVLFIFIIMLMVFALNFQMKTDDQVRNIREADEIARQLDELQKEVDSAIAGLTEADQTRAQLLLDLETQLKAQGLDVQIDEANGVLRLTDDAVGFDPNQSVLVGRALENVAKIARVLGDVLPKYSDCSTNAGISTCAGSDKKHKIETVFIEGHTDVTGVDDNNWQLSTERAVNTYREIMRQAPILRELRNPSEDEIVSVSGYSSTRPIDESVGQEAWAKNRRIDLRFVMEVKGKERLEEIQDLTRKMKKQIDRLKTESGG